MKKGIFITFEGTEGGGKSTQIEVARQFFVNQGRKVLVIREPGATEIGESIRAILLNTRFKKMTPQTEMLLYLAARAQIVQEKILPAIKKKWVVLCDRFEDSTLAYQGYGRGLDRKCILEMSRQFVRGNLVPDLTFVLDIDPAVGMKRGGRHDRMEKQAMAFHRRVRQGFLDLAKKYPKRFCVMDATQPREAVCHQIREALSRVF